MSEASAAAVGTELTARITIHASSEKVWRMISDPTRMREWSPQVVRSWVIGGPAKLGSRFINLNQQGWKRWPTTAKIVRFVPESDLAFRIVESKSVWSFQLESLAAGGTAVTHRRETPQGISGVSTTLTKAALGGVDAFTAELLEGMAQTLERMRSDAEA
jgi:uncharacterized protein YndB with AHSA1/START domain